MLELFNTKAISSTLLVGRISHDLCTFKNKIKKNSTAPITTNDTNQQSTPLHDAILCKCIVRYRVVNVAILPRFQLLTERLLDLFTKLLDVFVVTIAPGKKTKQTAP